MSKAKYSFLRGFITGSAASVTCCLAYFIGIQKQGYLPATWKSGPTTDQYQPSTKKLDNMHPALEDIRNQELKRRVLQYGEPDAGWKTHIYSSHVLAYDQARKIPLWVAEHITTEHLQGKANRRLSRFQPEKERLSKRFSAVNEDYLGSGWSRGHMAPAGNYKYDQSSMDDTFFLTNVLPQNYENNAGFWNRLEIFCRDLTKHYTDVRVISGPVFLPNKDGDGKMYIKYEVIGQSLVAVPTHLYKVVVAEEKGKEEKAVATFIVPNKPLDFNQKLIDFQVPLEELELRTGLEFLQELPSSQRTDLCQETGCQLMSREKFELYFLSRRLEGARNITQLEKAWSELEEKKLKPNKAITDLYKKRLQELQSKEEKKKTEL